MLLPLAATTGGRGGSAATVTRPIAALLTVAAMGMTSCASDAASSSKDAPRTVTVERVVDGDTLALASGARVRIIGIDTPEVGTCGFEASSEAMRRMVEGRRVDLVDPASVQDTDTYDRLLRFVEVDGTDVGFAQIEAGRARARYDSRDGYDPHPREDRYRAADRKSANTCD